MVHRHSRANHNSSNMSMALLDVQLILSHPDFRIELFIGADCKYRLYEFGELQV